MNTPNQESTRAFNAGCQARLSGVPYRFGGILYDIHHVYLWWRKGWRDVDRHWGQENADAAPLPICEEESVCLKLN